MSELLTVDEIAREFRIHPITVRRHIAAGRLKALRIGRSVRVRREDLDDFLGQTERPPKRKRTGILSLDDPIFQIIGMGSDPATDVSENKHKYLADAYLAEAHRLKKS